MLLCAVGFSIRYNRLISIFCSIYYIYRHSLIRHTENDEKIKCYLNTNLVLYLNLIYHFVFPKIEPYNIFSPIAFGELNES